MYTVWRGYGICEECHWDVLEFPDSLPMGKFLDLQGEMEDEFRDKAEREGENAWAYFHRRVREMKAEAGVLG
jgi:hypothetical protein